MAQWESCKAEAKDALLLFRMGDFYEAFHEDAEKLSELLDLVLTRRQGIPMSGIPHHTLDSHLDRLIEKGFKVAIADQLENPKEAKGLVKRGIVRIVTRSTSLGSKIEEKESRYLVSLVKAGSIFALAALEPTTGDFRVIQLKSFEEMEAEIFRLNPKECLYPSDSKWLKSSFIHSKRCSTVEKEPSFFDEKLAREALHRQLGVKSLDGFGLKDHAASIQAAGSLVRYLKEDLLFPLHHIRKIAPYTLEKTLIIDPVSMGALELVETSSEGKNTLLRVLDQTLTPMGARKLAEWLKKPLCDLSKIEERQEAIQELLEDAARLHEFSSHLKKIRDIERLMMRISGRIASPKDCALLKESLVEAGFLKRLFARAKSPFLQRLQGHMSDMQPLVGLLSEALVDDPPLNLDEGELFKQGYSHDLDRLQNLAMNSKKWLLDYQKTLQDETQIAGLKISYNRVFGYTIEVSRARAKNVPAHFERKQTLATSERFTTLRLREFEAELLTSEEARIELQKALFAELVNKIAEKMSEIFEIAEAIALADALQSLAHVAKKRGYTRPKVDGSSLLKIQGARHPVLEALMNRSSLIPNDIEIDESKRLLLITGPNMAGKSTYLRTAALLVILAQMGSFVPAESMHLGLVDRIFTRIGASDDLARGQSTFMVEMSETANLLNNSSSRSLAILDEIGRGTSTYDGLAIAWSVTEYLLRAKTRTLLATHYFELTALEKRFNSLTNLHAEVREVAGQIVFFYRIVQGRADRSYGIQVARLAGLPLPVTARAEEILKQLEEKKKKSEEKQMREDDQLSLF